MFNERGAFNAFICLSMTTVRTSSLRDGDDGRLANSESSGAPSRGTYVP